VALIYLKSKKLVDVGNNFTYDDSAKTYYSKLTKIQKENRQLLIDIMTNVGFVNYPYEWWHWSYGDKYWAYIKKRRFAIYKTLKMLK